MHDASTRERPESPWSLSANDAAKALDVDPAKGVSAEESRARLDKYGPNQLREEASRGLAKIFFSQFAELMIILLAVAAVISAIIGEWTDSALIGVIVLANAVVGTAQEFRAEQAVAALKKLSQPSVRVLRDGQMLEISAEELVPGDVVDVKAGDLISADCRLLDAFDLQADEAPLTGESLPVQKSTEPVDAQTPLPDRTSMIYSGTAVTFGHGRGVVMATGMDTELGHIAGLLQETERAQTPLQARLAVLSKRLAIIVVLLSLIVFAAGVLREDSENWDRKLFGDMLLIAVSLAVAAIPEGLPAVITVALALGSQRAAKRKAIVRRLAAVETLGSVDVICSDKTGTLTQNLMSVSDLIGAKEGKETERRLLEFGVLCNDAQFDPSGDIVGSATEAAILRAGKELGIDIEQLKQEWPRVAEVPFSSAQKRMVTLHRAPDGARQLIVKGAAEAVLEHCDRVGLVLKSAAPLDDKGRSDWRKRADELAGSGRRLLAIALHEWDRDDLNGVGEAPLDALVLVGMIGIVDPVRPEAKEAIRLCRSAGIRPVMITGDHPGTARSIAEELKLAGSEDRTMSGAELDSVDDGELVELASHVAVYARVTPNHKLRIVKALQARKSVVGMTGDGVNDAPALKQSDIGIAMGVTGTDVSRQAADMVLADDNFSTIVAAVEEGRIVYDNIRKFVRYMLTTNAAEVAVLFFAILFGLPLPLLPIHILWINLVTDGLPALALGFEPAEKDIMQRPPRRREESVFADGVGRDILWVGMLASLCCLGIYIAYLKQWIGVPIPEGADERNFIVAYARTAVFVVLSLSQLFLVLALRSTRTSFFAMSPWSNYRLTLAVIAGIGAQLAIVYVPVVSRYFHAAPLSMRDLGICIAAALVPFAAVEIQKSLRSPAPLGGEGRDEVAR